MTFDLSDEQRAIRDRVREWARERVAPRAQVADQEGIVPSDLIQAFGDEQIIAADADPLTRAIVIEELAAVSGSLAGAVAFSGARPSGDSSLSGLRGVAPPAQDATHGRFALASVALGLGRVAVELALATLRTAARGSDDRDKPHWVLADAATELEAARLLTWAAAQALQNRPDAAAPVAIAKLAATTAAQRAVDAALRIVGTDGFTPGSALERLARDVRAASLLLGTEEDQRTTAAAELFPM